MTKYDQLELQLGKRRLNNALLVSRRYHYAYMSNPKAACSTIKLYLARVEHADPTYSPPSVHERQYLPHIKPAHLSNEEKAGLFHEDFFVFSFVRHPFSRVISAYEDKIRGDRPQKAEILERLGRDPNQLSIPVSFDEFVHVISQQDPHSLNPHWRPQAHNLAIDVLPYSFLGRLESFQHDFAQVQNNLALPVYETVSRNQKGAARSTKPVLTQRQRIALSDLYYRDFRDFGYTMKGIEHFGRFRRRTRRMLRRATPVT